MLFSNMEVKVEARCTSNMLQFIFVSLPCQTINVAQTTLKTGAPLNRSVQVAARKVRKETKLRYVKIAVVTCALTYQRSEHSAASLVQ